MWACLVLTGKRLEPWNLPHTENARFRRQASLLAQSPQAIHLYSNTINTLSPINYLLVEG